MWSEWVTPETIDSRIWPRTAAIAERFWSPREVNDVAEMYRRLPIISARLEEAGALHQKNYEPMLRRLIGGEAPPAAMAALRTFVDAVEPLKRYTRVHYQTGVTQQTPLTGVADCARPESETARLFTDGVEQWLLRERALQPEPAASLRQQLQAWCDAGAFVVRDLTPKAARLKDAVPVAQNLVDASEIGLEAIAALVESRAMTAEWREARLAVLDRAAQSGPAAIELPMLPALRLLVAAASEQEKRATLSVEAWGKLLNDLVSLRKTPPKPAAP